MKSKIFLKTDPYQVLFPLGLAHAIWGALLWILFSLNLVAYPGVPHAHHMIDGFLLSFAAGFLMTAIPRFTGTDSCSRSELLIAAVLSLVSLFSSDSIATLGMILFLSSFFGRRITQRKVSPPPHFVFIPIALLLGLSGSLLFTLIQFEIIDARYAAAARLFLYYGMMLSFLLGVGAKLISALLGWAALPTHRMVQRKSGQKSNKWVVPSIQGALFLLSFPIELGVDPSIGRALRAICATWIGIENWKFYKRPKAEGKLAFWLWIAGILLIVGLWIHALFPSLGVHAAHVVFISGFGMITLLIASRVTLSHGGYSLDFESHSRIYVIACLFIILAAITRVTAVWTGSYFQHLNYAAALWLVAILSWSTFFLPKMLKRKSFE